MANNQELLKAFRRHLRLQRGLSPNTLEAYMRDVGKLIGWSMTREESQRNVSAFSLADLEEFSASLHDLGISAATHARILCGVRAFYRYLELDGYIEQDPAELLEAPIQDKHLPEVLSTTEIDLMQEATVAASASFVAKNGIDAIGMAQRNKAIIEVLFSCGLRVSELVNLTMSMVYEEEGFVRILGKGSKERLVPISPRAIEELHRWYAVRSQMRIKPGEEDYVFLNLRGSHLTRTMILLMIKDVATAAGIKKTISPHTLRHSFATALLEGGASLRAIQAMLGHESIGTTEIYTHIDMTTLRDDILHHHPRNKIKNKE